MKKLGTDYGEGLIIHGDADHSCYDDDGVLTCVVWKMYLTCYGPDWRTLAKISYDRLNGRVQ